MGWRDNNTPVEGKKEIPKINYFPELAPGGEVIREATFDPQNDPSALRDQEKMIFDEGRSELGQIIGGLAAPVVTMKQNATIALDKINIKGKDVKNLVPKPLRTTARVLHAVASTWAGGAGGDLLQSAAQGDLTKRTWGTALDSAWEAGNEEAIYELLGQGLVGTVVKGLKFAAGKPYANIQWIKDRIKESGGQLTASQVVDGTIIDTIEGLSEAAWGGGHIRDLRVKNDQAIENFVNDYQQNFINVATDNLSSKELGRIYVRSMEVATKTHSEMGGQLFTHLDEVLAKNKKFKQEPFQNINQSTILDSSGTNFTNIVSGTKRTEVLPVSTKGIKSWAKSELTKIKGAKGAIDEWRFTYFENILKNAEQGGVDDFISFSAAQQLRSTWLAKGRKFELKSDATYNLADAAATTQLSKQLDQAMGDSASRIGGEFYDEYRAANKFWKAGKNRLQNKVIAGIVTKNPELIGAQIFKTGDVTEIQAVRNSIRAAAFFTKGTDKAINFEKTWKQMQQGYIQDLIGSSRNVAKTQLTAPGVQNFGTDVAGGEMNITALKELFIPNTPLNRTFTTVFSKPQRQSIKRFTSALEAAQRTPQGSGTFMVTVGQAGLIMAGLGGAGFAAAGGAGAIAALTITPAMLSRAMTNPTVVNWLASGLHMKPTNRLYAPMLLKLANYFGLAPQYEDVTAR